jgi:hypothetical protein
MQQAVRLAVPADESTGGGSVSLDDKWLYGTVAGMVLVMILLIAIANGIIPFPRLI